MTRFAFLTRPAAAPLRRAAAADRRGRRCRRRRRTRSPTSQKAAIGEMVKEYLLKNPEVIQEALVELDRRQKDAEKRRGQEGARRRARPLLTSPPRNVVVGNPHGDVTLVEFMDYNCTYCKRSLADLRELIKARPQAARRHPRFPGARAGFGRGLAASRSR